MSGYMKILVLGIIIFLAPTIAAAEAAQPVGPGTFYPLTITAQSAMKGGGDSIAFKVTVTNTSPKLRFAPLVFLDHFASIDTSNSAQLYKSSTPTGPSSPAKLVRAFSPLWGNLEPAWTVGVLKPGQARSLVIWYNTTVTFPPYTDPKTGITYQSPPATMGVNYEPSFVLYDSFYKQMTFANVAQSANFTGGGK